MILVTGANGFLGSFICRELILTGHEVKALIREDSNTDRIDDIMGLMKICKADLHDLPALDTCFSEVDTVIHCAARISFQGHDCDELIYSNVESTRNVVNLSLKYGINRFIHISSTAAIGRSRQEETLNEENQWQESRHSSCYGKSKYLSELEVWRGKSEGLNVTVLNPSVIIGRNTLGESSGLLLDYATQPHKFYPTGDLNYVDVRDVVKIALRFLDHTSDKDKFIINGGNVSYKDFFTRIAELVGIKPPALAAEGYKLKAALWGDQLRSLFTGSQRMLSREMIRTASSKLYFDNERIRTELNYTFIPLMESLKWIYSDPDPVEKK